MADQQLEAASFNNGLGAIKITFDDVTGAIKTITEINNGPSGTLSYVLTNPGTSVVVRQGTVAANSGTKVVDITPLALTMISFTHHGVAGWRLPLDAVCSWSSA